MNVEVK